MSDTGFPSPLIKAALLPSAPGELHPPLEKEMEAMTTGDQDILMSWIGSWNRNGRKHTWSWQMFFLDAPEGVKPPMSTVPAEKVERLLSPLAHEVRIRLMQALYGGPRSSGQLSEATGLKGGNLYYHLKELIYASYVTEREGKYDLTGLGCQMLATMSLLAEKLIED